MFNHAVVSDKSHPGLVVTEEVPDCFVSPGRNHQPETKLGKSAAWSSLDSAGSMTSK